MSRYARQLALPDWGEAEQQRIENAHILMIGAGGLGSPALLYLAAAGVGRITLADGDRVSESNLNRQLLFETADDGRLKVEAARDRIQELNPHVQLTLHSQMADVDWLSEVAGTVDIIIDGSDNYDTRSAINSAAHRASIPWVYAGLHQFSGMVASFYPHHSAEDACFHCLFPEPPTQSESCADAGILGAFAGIIGSMQALEALHILSGKPAPLRNKILHYDGHTHRSRITQLTPDAACPVT